MVAHFDLGFVAEKEVVWNRVILQCLCVSLRAGRSKVSRERVRRVDGNVCTTSELGSSIGDNEIVHPESLDNECRKGTEPAA